jgi:hypothetical protein
VSSASLSEPLIYVHRGGACLVREAMITRDYAGSSWAEAAQRALQEVSASLRKVSPPRGSILGAIRRHLPRQRSAITLALGADLCVPVLLPPVDGLRDQAELMELARHHARNVLATSAEVDLWLETRPESSGPLGAPVLVGCLEQSTRTKLEALNGLLVQAVAVRLVPWWLLALQQPDMESRETLALSVQEPAGRVLLCQDGSGRWTAADRLLGDLDVEVGQRWIRRRLAAVGIQDTHLREVVLKRSPDHPESLSRHPAAQSMSPYAVEEGA